MAGDPSPSGGGPLSVARGIEVGQIFQLGTKYSDALGATVLDTRGGKRAMHMGCYGIGVTRVIAAAVEQNHDEHGIIWPHAIAPFDVIIVPINLDKSERVRETAAALHDRLSTAGLEVLVDDRPQRPGFKFADADLIGIPHRVVIAERGLKEGQLEYKGRRENEVTFVPVDSIVEFLRSRA